MKPTPFNDKKDLAPIPFDPRLLELAFKMKKAGLDWDPHVGCFVWDRENVIEVGSPFPENIYFILNLGHFLRIFETIEKLKEKLVFVPTWNQARQILEKIGGKQEELLGVLNQSKNIPIGEEMISLYKVILRKI